MAQAMPRRTQEKVGAMEDREPKGRRQLPVILLSVLAGILLFMLVFHLHRHTFSRQRWLDEPKYRKYMLSNLERRHPFDGMTMEEITALLGSEDSRQSSFKLSGTTYPPETTLVYYIGKDYADDLWLILSFEDGVCVSHTVDIT